METFFRPVVDTRDYSVLQFQVRHPPYASNIGVLWDADRDIRILRLLIAARYRLPAIFSGIRAIGEHQGSVSIWYDREGVDQCRARDLLQQASNDAMQPEDTWEVQPLKIVACRPHAGGRLLLRDQLPTDDPLLVVPEHRPVGLVRP